MASQQFLSEILWLTMIFLAPPGSDAVQKAGNLASNQVSDVMSQICPSDNPFRRTYVRIKTFNGKYWHAIPQCYWGGTHFCVKTRCCGAKASMHQRDIKEPGRRTTFKVHCERNKETNNYHVAQFEVLNYDDNNPSKYFLCNQADWSRTYTSYINGSSNKSYCSWILHNYRGSVIGLEPFNVWKWITFEDSGRGIVSHGMYKKRSWPFKDIDHGTRVANRPTPYLDDTYTLEIVPQECLDVANNEKIQAAKSDATVEQCEESPDRCFMNNGWTPRNVDHPPGSGPKCFYRKDAPCFQPSVANRKNCEDRDTGTPEKCETANANCCFDYSICKCYQALSE